MNYHAKCQELADAALADCDLTGYQAEWRACELAQQIQAVIESYIVSNDLPRKPKS